MKLFFIFARRYPYRSLLMVMAMIFAGLSEGFGISVFVPLLALILGQDEKGLGAVRPDATELEQTLLMYLQDMLTTFGIANVIATLLVLFVVCMTLKCALVLVAQNQIGFTAARITTDLRLQFLKILFRTRWEHFMRQPTGKLVTGVALESTNTAMAFDHSARMLSYMIEAGFYTCIALMVSWQASLMALAIGLVIVFLLGPFVRKARRAGKDNVVLAQAYNAQMVDSLVSIKPLKAMGREASTLTVLKRQTKGLKRLQKEVVTSKAVLSNVQEPLMIGFVAIILYVAVIQMKMALPVVVAMIYLIRRVLKNVHKVQQEYQKFVLTESSYWSLLEKMREAEEKEETFAGREKPHLNKAIRLDHIGFKYDEKEILRNLCLDLPQGKFVTVIGPSGAGKTTLADLMIGLIRPQEGEIWIDDLPLGTVDINQWRQMIGYVPQETLLLHDSVFINVTLGSKVISEADVENALKAAGVWDFVSKLDEGIHTVVGERGSKISGGQRQRIAIARALVNKPKLLILDEATTALDPETEKAICQTMKKLAGEITIFAISHQKALLEAADIAYRLEGGILKRLNPLDGTDNTVDAVPEKVVTTVASQPASI